MKGVISWEREQYNNIIFPCAIYCSVLVTAYRNNILTNPSTTTTSKQKRRTVGRIEVLGSARQIQSKHISSRVGKGSGTIVAPVEGGRLVGVHVIVIS